MKIGNKYGQKTKHDDALGDFRKQFLEPFYGYVDENIDDQCAILYLLKKYKHRCEWFRREKLFKLWKIYRCGYQAAGLWRVVRLCTQRTNCACPQRPSRLTKRKTIIFNW